MPGTDIHPMTAIAYGESAESLSGLASIVVHKQMQEFQFERLSQQLGKK
jgi:hypothetical protein